MTDHNRKMPKKIDFGQHRNTTMATVMMERRYWLAGETPNPHGYRVVMGHFLPPWQRGLVWSQAQQIAFVESAWRGVGLGTYTVNMIEVLGHPLDNLLVDGQQRMHAVECYLTDQFPVFGWRYSEVGDVDRRHWEMTTMFASYVTSSEDEAFLRSYYDLLNFGGVPHTPDQHATGPRDEYADALDAMRQAHVGFPTGGALTVAEVIEAEITAEGAAEGADQNFPDALNDSEVRIWINACNHEPARQALRQLLAYRVRGVSAPLSNAHVIAAARDLRDKWRTPGQKVDGDDFFAAIHAVSEAVDAYDTADATPKAAVAWRWCVREDINPDDVWHYSDVEPSFSPRDLPHMQVEPLYAHPAERFRA